MMFNCNILHQHGVQQMNLTHSSSLHQGSCYLLRCQCSSDCAYILSRLCTPGAYRIPQSWLRRLLNYLTSYRPSRLPAPLSSHSSILEPTTVFRDDTEYHRVVAVEPHTSASNTTWHQEDRRPSTSFPRASPETLPKLQATYRIPNTGHVYLIMQRMPSVSLCQLWPTLKNF